MYNDADKQRFGAKLRL